MPDPLDIYALREESQHPPSHWRRSRRPLLPHGARLGRGQWIAWLCAAIVVLGIGGLAARDGISLRRQIWQGTRSIRFPGDIEFGYRNGKTVLKLARIVQKQEKDTRPEPTVRQLGIAMARMYTGMLQIIPDGNYDLDYPPLRLFTMALWARHVHEYHPEHFDPQPFSRGNTDGIDPQSEDIARPMMILNTVCAGVSAVIMFLLVWLWVRRSTSPEISPSALKFFLSLGGLVAAILGFRFAVPKTMPSLSGALWPELPMIFAMIALVAAMVMCARRVPGVHRGWACGLVAALLLWFDPLILTDSHAWPQWDVWILPAILLAILLASLEWWTTAGFIMGIACMAKGQLFLGGPVFVLWPLMGGRIKQAIRIASGWALGSAAVVWPWIVRSDAGIQWLRNVAIVAGLVFVASLLRRPLMRKRRTLPEAAQMRVGMEKPRPKWPWALAATCAAVVTLGAAYVLIFMRMPTLAHLNAATIILMLVVVIPPWFVRRSSLGFWLAAVFAIAVWTSALAFDSNFDWLKLGFLYGARKQDKLQMGAGSFTNLATLLGVHYGWNLHDIVGTARVTIHHLHIDWSWDCELKSLLALVYGVTLLIASGAAAAHSRRNDPKLLIALAVPWIMFPILMCQMSERYLLWASAITCAMVAISTGMTLLHMILTLLGAGMMLHHMMQSADQQNWWPGLYEFFSRWYPDGAWAMLMLAAIFLAAALTHSRRDALADE